MKIFVAMICDRHAEPEPYLFSTVEAATAYARAEAEANARDVADIKEESIKGWLYHAMYSVEGDSVWVLEKDLEEGE
jgi:hypothetical protein